MRIAMIGAGYVGLVSGACLADFGHIVTCIDKDPDKVAALLRGEMPIFEPGLAELVAKNAREERLFFTTKLAAPAEAADAIFIAVGTPSRRGDGHADLSYVFQAAREIGAHLNGYKIVVTKSTVPVGTGDEVARILAEARPDASFAVVSNPEFLREGAPSATSSGRIASSSAPTMSARVKSCRISTVRCISIGPRCCSPAGARPSSSSMRPTPSWR
jgi:UDPglucose 6-dehydrogenase